MLVYELIAHPSTWDGNDADVRIGLFTSREDADRIYDEWIKGPRNRYPYQMGEWSKLVYEVPLDTVLTR